MKKSFTTFSGQVIFLIILVVIVVILAALLPPRMKNVEGFSGARSSRMLNYASVDGRPIDSFNNNNLQYGGENAKKSCVRAAGGLYCNGGDDATLGKIDKFYSMKSDTSCPGSGLSKGNGNICLDKTTKGLLTSRGGNVTWGGDSQIG